MNKIVQYKNIFFILSILTALPFIVQLPKIKIVENVDYFTLENDLEVKFYNDFKKRFGNDEFFVIAFEKETIFTNETLTLIKEITRDLEKIEDIREVKSLANVLDTIGDDNFFSVKPFLETIPVDKTSLKKLKTAALSNNLYVDNFISSDAGTTAFLVYVYNRPNDPGYRKRLLEKCKITLAKYEDRTGQTHMAGWTITNLFLSQYMKQDVITFIPITYLFISLAVFLFFRNMLLTIAAVVNISLCMSVVMGLFPIFNVTLNNVTTIIPPLVMALSLCDTVHIFSNFNNDLLVKFKTKEKAMSHVLKNLLAPCFLATITTTVGFLSLYLSDIPPIKDFAIIAACGMIFKFFFSFLFLPTFLLFFHETKIFRGKKKVNKINSLLLNVSNFIMKNYKRISLFGTIIMISSLWFAFQIQVETNLVEYFKKNSEVRSAIDFVERKLAGIGSIDISLHSTQEDAFKNPDNLVLIEKIQAYIKTIEGVDKTISFVDFIRDMNQSFHNEKTEYYTIPKSKPLIAQYLLLYDLEDIQDFITESFDHSRISIRLSEHSTENQNQIIKQIELFLQGLDTHEITVRITGRALQDVNTIGALIKGQLYSLTAAAITIIIIMFFVLRSFKMGCVSIVPNLFPIIVNFGIMGLFNIPLNTATALISAVAIGIAVDDTIHFLTELKRKLISDRDIEIAITKSILFKGKAILLSSLILCIGFGVLIFSLFVPTINFGVLSAITMITAVIGDVIILPSVLLFLTRSGIKFNGFERKGYGA